jgi:hypothetical protein
MYLTARFDDEALVKPAVEALLEAGFPPQAIEVFSARPVELPAALHPRRSRASLLAVLGAAVNGGLATAFMFYTQHDYPLVTGGMPLRSWWATGVITYELTMAGAVAGLMIALLWEAGLLRRRKPPAPVLDNNSVFVRVKSSGDNWAAALERLRQGGAVSVTGPGEEQ